MKSIYLYRSDLGRPFCNSIHLIFVQSLSPYMEDSLGQVNVCCQHSTLPNNAWHSKNLTYVVTFLQLFTLCFSLLDSVVGETLQWNLYIWIYIYIIYVSCLGSAKKRRRWPRKLLSSRSRIWIRQFQQFPTLQARSSNQNCLNYKDFSKEIFMNDGSLCCFKSIQHSQYRTCRTISWEAMPPIQTLEVWRKLLGHLTMWKRKWLKCHVQNIAENLHLLHPLLNRPKFWGTSTKAELTPQSLGQLMLPCNRERMDRHVCFFWGRKMFIPFFANSFNLSFLFERHINPWHQYIFCIYILETPLRRQVFWYLLIYTYAVLFANHEILFSKRYFKFTIDTTCIANKLWPPGGSFSSSIGHTKRSANNESHSQRCPQRESCREQETCKKR